MPHQTPHESGSAFLRIPTETRLQIYSCLLPTCRLVIDLCDVTDFQLTPVIFPPPKSTRDVLPPPHKKQKRCSPISSMVTQNLALDAITRANGLQLLLVSVPIAGEVTALLSKIPVRFHCPKCFDQWLCNNSYGLGVGINWLKRVEILFNADKEPRIPGYGLQHMTLSLSKFMAHETMKQCQHTAYAYYGRLDLMHPPREKWEYEVFQSDNAYVMDGREPAIYVTEIVQGQEHVTMLEAPPDPIIRFFYTVGIQRSNLGPNPPHDALYRRFIAHELPEGCETSTGGWIIKASFDI